MNYPTNEPNVTNVNGSGDKVVVTLKADAGYDAPWVVFHGSSNAEVADLIGAAEATGLLALVARASGELKGHYQAGKGLGATPVQSPAAAEQQYQQGGYQQQPPPQQAPPGNTPTCPHGTKTYKSGNGAKGPWQAYFCPARDKAQQCPPQWLPNN